MGNMIQGWKDTPCAPSLSARESNSNGKESTEGETVESPEVQPSTEKVDDDCRNDDFFPLLLLPKEIILIIFHLLPTADRMRARLCRALYQMEKNESFSARMLMVGPPDDRDYSRIIFLPIDDVNIDNSRVTLKKLADNVSIEYAEYISNGENDLDLIPLIKEITCEELFISFNEDDVPYAQDNRLNQHVDEASFNSWIANRKTVYLFTWTGLVGFSGEDLFKLFNDMASGLSELVQLRLRNIRHESTRELLNLLGITYNREEEEFTSTMKDSSIFVVKDERDPAGEYREALRVDFVDEPCPFEEGPRYVLFIVCGRMRLAVRKWAVKGGTNAKRYHNEFAMERFDENGEAVDGMMEEKGAYDVSIADMIRTPTRFEMLPPHMYRIEP